MMVFAHLFSVELLNHVVQIVALGENVLNCLGLLRDDALVLLQVVLDSVEFFNTIVDLLLELDDLLLKTNT